MRLAEFAYSSRDLLALSHISERLLTIPDVQAQRAGYYYSALVAKRTGDDSRAIELLSGLNGARAIQTLGAIEFDAGRHDAALPLFVRAAKAAQGFDVATSLNALYQISAIRSIAGNHQQALDDLLSLWPVVRAVKASHPHLYFNWHNDCAFELLELGRIQEAKESLSVALASPVAENYHEYSETRAEIERYERKKIIVAVRSLPKAIAVFRFCFIAKRFITVTVKPRVPTLTRSITERVTINAQPHAPPFNW